MSFMKKKMEGSEEDPKGKNEPVLSEENQKEMDKLKEKNNQQRTLPMQSKKDAKNELFAMLKPSIEELIKTKIPTTIGFEFKSDKEAKDMFEMFKPLIKELIDDKVIAPQVDEVLKLFKEDEIVSKKELKKITDFYENLHNDFGNKIDGHTSQLGDLRTDIESRPMTMQQRADNIKFPLFMEIVDEIREEKIRGYNFDPTKRSPHYKPFLIFFEKTLKHIKKLNNL